MKNETIYGDEFSQLDTATFFGVTLVIVQLGIFRGYCTKSTSPKSFLAGNRSTSNIKICTSIAIQAAPHALLAVTWAFLPGHEIVHLASAFGALVAGAITVLLFTPIVYDMCENSISIYAYLERRFSSSLPRRFVSLLYIGESCVMIAIHMYAPSLTISEVSGIPAEVCIWLIILGICVSTVLSGVRGLFYTNFVQVILVVGALFAVLFEANNAAGAIDENASTHLKAIVSGLNGWTFTVALIAWSAHWLLHFVSHQSFARRTASAKSRTRAQFIVGVSSAMIFGFMLLGSVVGSSLKGAHAREHLFETQRDDRSSDQVIYFFVKQAYGYVPGLPGLLTGMLFCAYIGSAASLCNAVTSVLYEDFAEPCFKLEITQRFRLSSARYMGFIPLICSSVVALTSYFVKIAPSILLNLTGTIGGPIISFFSIGLLNSRCSLKASMFGLIAGLIAATVASWIFFVESSATLTHSSVFAAFERKEDAETSAGKTSGSSTSLREWFQAWSASVVWVELLAFLVSMLMTLIVSLCGESSKLSDSDPDSHVANSNQTEFCDITSYTRRESDSAADLTEFSKNPRLKSPD